MFIEKETKRAFRKNALRTAGAIGIVNLAALFGLWQYSVNKVNGAVSDLKEAGESEILRLEQSLGNAVDGKVNQHFNMNSRLLEDIQIRISSLSSSESELAKQVERIDTRREILEDSLVEVETAASLVKKISVEKLNRVTRLLASSPTAAHMLAKIDNLEINTNRTEEKYQEVIGYFETLRNSPRLK